MTCKNNLVLANYRAAANSVDTDLIFGTLFAVCVSVIHILGLLAESLGDPIRKHERGSAWSVDFLVMVLFYDFDIKAVSEHPCSLF